MPHPALTQFPRERSASGPAPHWSSQPGARTAALSGSPLSGDLRPPATRSRLPIFERAAQWELYDQGAEAGAVAPEVADEAHRLYALARAGELPIAPADGWVLHLDSRALTIGYCHRVLDRARRGEPRPTAGAQPTKAHHILTTALEHQRDCVLHHFVDAVFQREFPQLIPAPQDVQAQVRLQGRFDRVRRDQEARWWLEALGEDEAPAVDPVGVDPVSVEELLGGLIAIEDLISEVENAPASVIEGAIQIIRAELRQTIERMREGFSASEELETAINGWPGLDAAICKGHDWRSALEHARCALARTGGASSLLASLDSLERDYAETWARATDAHVPTRERDRRRPLRALARGRQRRRRTRRRTSSRAGPDDGGDGDSDGPAAYVGPGESLAATGRAAGMRQNGARA